MVLVNKTNMKKKIIIIGAGPGGLTTGIILSKRGFDVTIFEKESEVGGRNAPIKINGFTFDTGPTFLMMKFILDEMFEEAGKNINDYLEFIKIDPMYRLHFPDFNFDVNTDVNEMKKQVKEKFSNDEKGLEKFYFKEKERFEKLFPCLQKDYVNFYTFFHPDFIKALPILGIGQSLFENLGNYFKSEKLRLCFTFQSKYLGMSPWECPAGFTIIPYIEHEYGIYHVKGGLNMISHAMKKVFNENGGTLLLEKNVKKLILEKKKVVGIELINGEKHFADEIIINEDFAYAMTSLLDKNQLKKYSKKNLDKKNYSCSTFMIYLGLSKKYNIPHHNIYFANDYRTNVDDIFKRKIMSLENSFYIQNASIIDDSLAPKDKSALYILVPVPNNFSNIEWKKEQSNFRNKIIEQVIKKTGFNDLEENIEVEKVITPADWENEFNVYKGATFNLSHELPQMLYFRPRNKFEELDNCYLVGGGTHPGSGLPTIYESARISANLISKKYNIPFIKPSILKNKSKNKL